MRCRAPGIGGASGEGGIQGRLGVPGYVQGQELGRRGHSQQRGGPDVLAVPP